MADVRYGENALTPTEPHVPNKAIRINTSYHTILSRATEKHIWVTLDDADYTLSRDAIESNSIDFTGTLTADRVIDFAPNYEGWWLIRDDTTGGYDLTFEPTGETGLVLPKKQYVQLRRTSGGMEMMANWGHQDWIAAPSFGTNWGTTGARPLVIQKEDAPASTTGGFVKLVGSVEKSANCTHNETMLTLPVGCRPRIKVAYVCPVNPDVTTKVVGRKPVNMIWGGATQSSSVCLRPTGDVLGSTGGGTNDGHIMPTSGSVTAISAQTEVTAGGASGTWYASLYKNGTKLWGLPVGGAAPGVGFIKDNATASLGTYTFAAGDCFQMRSDFTTGSFVGTTTHVSACIELVPDYPHRECVVEISTGGVMTLRGYPPLSGETVDLSPVQFLAAN